jgi:hypothetical protein
MKIEKLNSEAVRSEKNSKPVELSSKELRSVVGGISICSVIYWSHRVA